MLTYPYDIDIRAVESYIKELELSISELKNKNKKLRQENEQLQSFCKGIDIGSLEKLIKEKEEKEENILLICC